MKGPLQRMLEWLAMCGPAIEVHRDGPIFDFVHVRVIDTPNHYWAFYVSRDRTGSWYDRWPHMSIFRDNG